MFSFIALGCLEVTYKFEVGGCSVLKPITIKRKPDEGWKLDCHNLILVLTHTIELSTLRVGKNPFL